MIYLLYKTIKTIYTLVDNLILWLLDFPSVVAGTMTAGCFVLTVEDLLHANNKLMLYIYIISHVDYKLIILVMPEFTPVEYEHRNVRRLAIF